MIVESQAKIGFSTAFGYNCVVSQSYLLGRFVKWRPKAFRADLDHAQGLANIASRLRGHPPHSLWRNGPLASFLQQTPTALATSELRQNPAASGRVSPLRSDPGSGVHHHRRPATHQQHRDPAIQWDLPLLAGSVAVSRPVHLAPLPQTDESAVHPSTRDLARPAARSATGTKQPRYRSSGHSEGARQVRLMCFRGRDRTTGA